VRASHCRVQRSDIPRYFFRLKLRDRVHLFAPTRAVLQYAIGAVSVHSLSDYCRRACTNLQGPFHAEALPRRHYLTSLVPPTREVRTGGSSLIAVGITLGQSSSDDSRPVDFTLGYGAPKMGHLCRRGRLSPHGRRPRSLLDAARPLTLGASFLLQLTRRRRSGMTGSKALHLPRRRSVSAHGLFGSPLPLPLPLIVLGRSV
jgi:hypothetical protein